MPETDAGVEDWTLLLETALRRRRRARERHDLRPLHRARGFRGHRGDPPVLLQAHALARTLERMPLRFRADERFFGAPEGFHPEALPAGVSENDLRLARTECGWSDFDAALGDRAHPAPDLARLLALGIGGLQLQVEDVRRGAPPAQEEDDFLRAESIVLDAIGRLAERQAEACRDGERADEARLLAHVSRLPPRTLHEALQLVWLVQLAFYAEGRGPTCLGRMDRWLEPLYLGDMETARIDREEALALLCRFFLRLAECPAGTWITLGGPGPGGGAAPRGAALLLVEALTLVPPPGLRVALRMGRTIPTALLRPVLLLLEANGPEVSLVNDAAVLPALQAAGVEAEAAAEYALGGAGAPVLPGRRPGRIAERPGLAQPLSRAFAAWRDGAPRNWTSLRKTLEAELHVFVADVVEALGQRIRRRPPASRPDPLLSLFARDCIERRRDVSDGGAVLPRIAALDLPDLLPMADALASVRSLICEGESNRQDALVDALADEFADNPRLRHRLITSDPRARSIAPQALECATWLYETLARLCDEASLPEETRLAPDAAPDPPPGGGEGGTDEDRDVETPWTVEELEAALPHMIDARRCTGVTIPVAFSPEAFRGDEGARRFAELARGFTETGLHALRFVTTRSAAG